MKDDRIAPEDHIWVCHMCGKTHNDLYGAEGTGSYGWDESCMLNAGLHSIDTLVWNGNKVIEVKSGEPE